MKTEKSDVGPGSYSYQWLIQEENAGIWVQVLHSVGDTWGEFLHIPLVFVLRPALGLVHPVSGSVCGAQLRTEDKGIVVRSFRLPLAV